MKQVYTQSFLLVWHWHKKINFLSFNIWIFRLDILNYHKKRTKSLLIAMYNINSKME